MKIVISAQKTSLSQKLREIVASRELLFFFAWRDIKVRYKQTFLGVLWVVIQPVVLVAIFSFVFGSMTSSSGDTTPYPVLAFVGIFFWILFSNIINTVGNSLVSNQHLIQKIYFPNILIPISATIVSLFDAIFMLLIMIAVFIFYGVSVSLAFPFVVLLCLLVTVLFGLGFGLFLGALNVKYRDVRHALPFIIQVLFFLSPVVYTLHKVPSNFSALLRLNPLTGIINSAQISISGFENFPWSDLSIAFLVGLGFLVLGLFTFGRLERQFSDFI